MTTHATHGHAQVDEHVMDGTCQCSCPVCLTDECVCPDCDHAKHRRERRDTNSGAAA